MKLFSLTSGDRVGPAIRTFALATIYCCVIGSLLGQIVRPSDAELRSAAGDVSPDPGAIDITLSQKITHKEVRRAMAKVADWSLLEFGEKFTQDWTYAPLYSGLLAASEQTHDARYHDAVFHMASDKFHWTLLQGRYEHADDEALGWTYEYLYREKPEALRIAAVKTNLAQVMARPDDPAKDLWWWCDALYMAPPSLSAMAKITGDSSYLTFMDRHWQLTTMHLYDGQQKLYSRDASFLDKREANGKKLFWSRGNGWVLAGLVRVMEQMPSNSPLRPQYEALYRDMAGRIAELQPADGLWRMGLLDENAYKDGEVSGTAFFTFAMAWGINHGVLDREKFTPVVERAWAGMLRHVYRDGRLGSIQPIGAAPSNLEPGSSWTYGVGGFLMAAAELDKMASR